MKLWIKVVLSGALGMALLGGLVYGVQKRSLASGLKELQRNGASGFEEAVSSLKLADTLGNSEAAYEIGKCYLEGKVTKVDRDIAMSWFQKAAKHDHPEAMAIVGQAALEGSGVPRDPIQGIGFLRRAAEAGSPRGMYEYGRALAVGRDIPVNVQLAITWMDRAAEARYVEAAFTRGISCLNEVQEVQKGIRFLEIADMEGNEQAAPILLSVLIKEDWSSPFPDRALAFLNKKSNQGHADSSYHLGVAHSYGFLGLQKDEKESERFTRLAAKQGSPQAIAAVAAMDAPKPEEEDPVTVTGPQVVIDGGGFARVQGLIRNTSRQRLDAHLQFDLVSPSGVVLDTYDRTYFRMMPGATHQIDIAIAPYHRDAHVVVQDVKWRWR